jgi:histidinol-phosphate aminotransferase
VTAARVRVRGAVEALPPYRGLAGARPPVRLDGNENPYGPSPLALAALHALEGDGLSRYPDARRLRAGWARRLGVPMRSLLLAPGSGPALALVAELVLGPGDACVLLEPSFELYAWAARRREAHLVGVPCQAGRPFPTAAFRRALAAHGPRLAVVGLPDNPTGVAPTRRWLASAARDFPRTLFLVDEAYHDFSGRTAIPLASVLPNVLVARTLSKAYGLAGARIGGVIGPRRLIDRLHRINLPYPVAGPACAAGLAALDDAAHVRRTVRSARRERRRMAAGLRRLGFTVTAPPVNFVLVHLGTAAAAGRVVAALARRGIAVRNRSHLRGMAGVVRVSCGTAAETDVFLAAMRALAPRRAASRRTP